MNPKVAALLLGMIFVVSILAAAIPANASGSSSLPTIQLGSFVPDQQAKNYGAYPGDIAKWFSVQWGSNSAYQVGAVDQPYQFVFGNFYLNGQQVAQDIYFDVIINVSVVMQNNDLAVPNNGATTLGAPSYDGLSLGDQSNPIRITFVQNNTYRTTNVTIPFPSNSNYYAGEQASAIGSIPSPTPVAAGPFDLVFSVAYYNFAGSFVGYIPVYIGEGVFNAVNAHVSGKPTGSVTSGTNSQATLDWSFSAGVWNVTFIHYRDNNPADLASSNIQKLAFYNFTYAQDGGNQNLTYNFTSSQPSGIYAWQIDESYKSLYGGVFLVYNNATSVMSGDNPPSVSIWIKPAQQNHQEIVSIKATDLKSSVIYLQVSIWFSNDPYTIPSPSFSNVYYYFAPYAVSNGQNISINFTDTFYGELNVQVISHNSYGMWNNSYAQSVVKENLITSTPGWSPPNIDSWFTYPFASLENSFFFVIGVLLLFLSIHESGLEENIRKRMMQQLGGIAGNVKTHYLAAIFFFFLSVLNWPMIFAAISSWGHLIP